MTLTEMLRANGGWEADAAVTAIRVRDMRIEKLEAALREIETLELDPRNSGQTWVEALRQIARKALEGKDDLVG